MMQPGASRCRVWPLEAKFNPGLRGDTQRTNRGPGKGGSNPRTDGQFS